MRAEEIRDRKSLEAWLTDQPRELWGVMAVRAGLRCMPSWFRLLGWENPERRAPEVALALFRCGLVSSVALGSPLPEVSAAAHSAVKGASAATSRSTRGAAAGATLAIASVLSAIFVADANASEHLRDAINSTSRNPEALLSARSDAFAVQSGMSAPQLLSAPLWASNPPAETKEEWRRLSGRLEAEDSGWRFWTRWYEGLLFGGHADWDMLTEIVLIPDADWRQGPRHVNAIIAGIMESHRGGGAGKRAEDLPPPAAARLQAQVAFLLQNATLAGANADVLATQIDAALSLFLNEVGLNDVPEDLRVFEHMAHTLRSLSRSVVAASEDGAELEALRQQVVDLGEQLAALRAEVACIKREGSLGRFLGRAMLGGAAATAGAGIVGYAGWFVYHYSSPEILNALVRDLMRRH
jgi:hypothetical protein